MPALRRAAEAARASRSRTVAAAQSRACVYSVCNCSIQPSLPAASRACRANAESRPLSPTACRPGCSPMRAAKGSADAHARAAATDVFAAAQSRNESGGWARVSIHGKY